MSYEFALTLAVAMIAVAIKRDALTSTLLIAWGLSFSVAFIVPASLLPVQASVNDVCIAIVAYYLWSEHDSQRARMVGVLSLAKLFCHFGISANFGSGDWFIYALLVNTGFVVQCLIAGGLTHGMVDFLNRVSPRDHDRRAPSSSRKAP